MVKLIILFTLNLPYARSRSPNNTILYLLLREQRVMISYEIIANLTASSAKIAICRIVKERGRMHP